ncbi:hypothetical protein B0H14DRAFT_2591841 [Mycena olivaceomarginata]|nr:hypothetical protein B0H14DRAFT_2591841 [Mycena olivaceomarginata]
MRQRQKSYSGNLAVTAAICSSGNGKAATFTVPRLGTGLLAGYIRESKTATILPMVRVIAESLPCDDAGHSSASKPKRRIKSRNQRADRGPSKQKTLRILFQSQLSFLCRTLGGIGVVGDALWEPGRQRSRKILSQQDDKVFDPPRRLFLALWTHHDAPRRVLDRSSTQSEGAEATVHGTEYKNAYGALKWRHLLGSGPVQKISAYGGLPNRKPYLATPNMLATGLPIELSM